MRAFTATFSGIETGIQVVSNPLGQPGAAGVYLGTPDREGRPFPYVALDAENPPLVTDSRLLDGTLRKIVPLRPGQMRWLLTADEGEPNGSLLVRFNTFEHSDSLAKHYGVNRAMLARGRGYADLEDKENTSWVDSIDIIEPGAVVEIVSRTPIKSFLGKLVMNIQGQLIQVPREDFRAASPLARDRMIRRALTPEGEQSRRERPSKASDAFRAVWPEIRDE